MHGPPLILVVDDDRDTLDATRALLEGEGYAVDVATTGSPRSSDSARRCSRVRRCSSSI